MPNKNAVNTLLQEDCTILSGFSATNFQEDDIIKVSTYLNERGIIVELKDIPEVIRVVRHQIYLDYVREDYRISGW